MRYCVQSHQKQRRGVILLVILAMLTIMAIVGVTFFYVANNHQTTARFYKEADFQRTAKDVIDVDADDLKNWGFSQLIFDVWDDTQGIQSSMRGHSLARTMYGLNDQDPNMNLVPFSGTGALHYAIGGEDNANLVNYLYFQGDQLRDPARLNTRADQNQPRGLYTGGLNVDYTFPNRENMFLAAVRSDGTLLMPSFHRPNTLVPADFTSPNGKYKMLTPRPGDHAGFPAMVGNGHVQNLKGNPGGNDSVWIDLGYPVQVSTNGRKFKPMFAFLVTDLDNRINLNTHGNIMGAGGTHNSHQGFGKWEMSLESILTAPDPSNPGSPEWRHLFIGGNNTLGRYGATATPNNGGAQPRAGSLAHVYGQVDYNGDSTSFPQLPSERTVNGNQREAYPFYPTSYQNGASGPGGERIDHAQLYNYFNPQGDDTVFPVSDMYAQLYEAYTGVGMDGTTIGKLCPANFGDGNTNTAAQVRRRNLVTLLSMDVNRPGVSPWLFDKANTVVLPSEQNRYEIATPGSAPEGNPVGLPSNWQQTLRTGNVPALSDFRTPGVLGTNPSADWRSRLAAQYPQLNLNRFLQPYPHQSMRLRESEAPGTPGTGAAYGPNGRFRKNHIPALSSGRVPYQQFIAAHSDRQAMASEIYKLLVEVTGANPPTPTTVTERATHRWLAQLAVNIVDFIDEDEISTPFDFLPNAGSADSDPAAVMAMQNGKSEKIPYGIVFGNELPMVVLNEVMTEYKEPNPPPVMGQQDFQVKVWVELANARQAAVSNPAIQTMDTAPVDFFLPRDMSSTDPVDTVDVSTYEVVIADTRTLSTNNTDPALPHDKALHNDPEGNPLGAPHRVRSRFRFTSDTTPNVGDPMATDPAQVGPQEYFLIGPYDPAPNQTSSEVQNTIKDPEVPANTKYYHSDDMQFDVTYDTNNTPPTWTPDDRPNGLTVLLRRLANPHLPLNENPDAVFVPQNSMSPYIDPRTNRPVSLYNPYVTVDYIQELPLSTTLTSYGKQQTFDSAQSRRAAQNVQVAMMPVVVNHTLGRQNSPIAAQTDWRWLAHLDRKVISRAEILLASAVRQHELLHRFINSSSGEADGHLAPWFDQGVSMPTRSHRLWRLFEFLTPEDRAAGINEHGRVPGKININTIWDQETFVALCSPQMNPPFNSTNIQNLWGPVQNSRNNRPFRSFGIGNLPVGDSQAPVGRGIEDTLFRSSGAGSARLLEVAFPGTQHPARKAALLTKIMDRLTTRSNVFAAWFTVGFFEVVNDQTLPVTLGAEIGAAQGVNIRHQFFGIIDRTQLTLHGRDTSGNETRALTSVTGILNSAATAIPTDDPVWITLGALSGTTTTPRRDSTGKVLTVPDANNFPVTQYHQWTINQGSYIRIGNTADKAEMVLVLQKDDMQNAVQVICRRNHNVGDAILIPGNPGPQQSFNANRPLYTPVIPYAVTVN